MSTRPRAGRAVLGPGQGATWVGEHGAHLMDYAAYHLAPDRALAAVTSALAACQAQPAPRDITARGWLLAVLRRDCRAAPGYREQYVPEAGPGMPDARLIERVWTIVDPLGTETLRLMYRHELAPLDLSHMLAMPVEEVGRLATRTQDLIETLVSGLDAIQHGRGTCPELPPLIEALFPGGLGEPADPDGFDGPDGFDESDGSDGRRTLSTAEFEEARTDLLSHMIKCSACTRPINIRYTVPQMISHPRIPPLTAEVRRRLLDSLPPPTQPPEPKSAPTPAEAADPGARTPPQEETRPGRAVRPGRTARPDRSTLPYLPVRPDRSTPRRPASPPRPDRPDRADRPDRPDRTDRTDRPERADHPDRSDRTDRGDRTDRMDRADRTDPGDRADRMNRTDRTAPADRTDPGDRAGRASRVDRVERADRSDRSTLPYLPVLPERPTFPSLPTLPAGTARPRSALSPPPAPSSQDTPLYDALLSQTRVRENDMTATNPAIPAITGQPSAGRSGDRRAPAVRAYARATGEPEGVRFGPGVRFVEALAWAGERVRSTTIKIVIIVVAGAAGTLTGMNLLGPAIGTERPAGSLQSSAVQDTTAGTAPAPRSGLAARLRIPPVVTLDEFGQGSLVLTISGAALDWRITAPGLAVSPSNGTLEQGRTSVITLRAHRIRQWCGVPSSVTAPLTVHGPDDSITTTVRWLTC